MSATLYRGTCPTCGWRGRALASESAAQFAAGKHWRQTGHLDATTRTATGEAPHK